MSQKKLKILKEKAKSSFDLEPAGVVSNLG